MTSERPWTKPLRAAYDEALQWPINNEAVEHLARLYLANGFNAEAEVLLPEIITRRPDAPEWVHRRAVLLANNGQLTEAVALWQSIRASTQPHLPVRAKLAEALLKLNRDAEAENIYRELLAAQPDYPYAWYGLVRLDLQHQHWEEAREKLRHAINASPNFYGHYALLATVAQHFGDAAEEAEADQQVKRLGRFRDVLDPWVESAVTDCYDPYRLRIDADRLRSDAENLGRATGIAGALTRIDRAIALAPNDAMNYQLLATIQGVNGNEAAAQRAYEKGLELDPQSVTLYLRYRNLLLRQGNDNAARALLTRGATHCPADAEIAILLADACAKSGDWPEATVRYRRGMTLRPDLPDLAPKAAMAAFRSGNEAAGLATLQENLQRYPRHEQTLGYLIMNAAQHGNASEARDFLQRLLTVAPNAPATIQLQQLVKSRLGDKP